MSVPRVPLGCAVGRARGRSGSLWVWRRVPGVRGRGRVRGSSDGLVDGRGLQVVLVFVQGSYEPGAVLGAAGGALGRLGGSAGTSPRPE